MSLKHIEITNNEGKVLRGYFNLPSNFNGNVVIMYHGFTGNKMETNGIFKSFSRLIAELGYGSLRMDFSGNGESDGEFYEMTFDSLLSEAILMLDYVKRMPGVKKIIILGFSMGGAIASLVAKEQGEDVDALLLWSPAGNMVELIGGIFEKHAKVGKNIDFGGWEISPNLYRTVKKYDFYEGLEKYENPTLIIHGSNDLSVNYKWGERFAIVLPNSEFILIEGAPHGYNSLIFKQELFEKSIKFIEKI